MKAIAKTAGMNRIGVVYVNMLTVILVGSIEIPNIIEIPFRKPAP